MTPRSPSTTPPANSWPPASGFRNPVKPPHGFRDIAMASDSVSTKAAARPIDAGTLRRDPDQQPKRIRPVLWWAALGAAAIAFQTYVYIAWMTSDDFKATP